ncbi:hypothetical protein WDZ92_03055, partial [Nostoc sp. NIES-2111]
MALDGAEEAEFFAGEEFALDFVEDGGGIELEASGGGEEGVQGSLEILAGELERDVEGIGYEGTFAGAGDDDACVFELEVGAFDG